MALTLIGVGSGGTSAAFRGIPSDETGINCSKFSLKLSPEINDWLPGITGESRGKAVSTIPMGTLSITGEILAATGVMAATFAVAFVPTNSVTYFGRSAGGFYLNDATVGYARDGWHDVECEFESRPLVA